MSINKMTGNSVELQVEVQKITIAELQKRIAELEQQAEMTPCPGNMRMHDPAPKPRAGSAITDALKAAATLATASNKPKLATEFTIRAREHIGQSRNDGLRVQRLVEQNARLREALHAVVAVKNVGPFYGQLCMCKEIANEALSATEPDLTVTRSESAPKVPAETATVATRQAGGNPVGDTNSNNETKEGM